MENMNLVIITGRLTGYPEEKTTDSGKKVCKFTVAVDRGRDENADTPTLFVRCTAWNEKAHFIATFFRKGQPIEVVGKLNQYTYQDKDLKDHEVWEVVPSQVFFVPRDNTEKDTRQEEPRNGYQSSRENANQDQYRNGDYHHGSQNHYRGNNNWRER